MSRGSAGTITLDGERAHVVGTCGTPLDLANWLRDLESDPGVSGVEIVSVLQGGRGARYVVTFHLTPPAPPEPLPASASPGGGGA